MIAKTDAIPIRISAFGGTSQIVTWLTPDHGKISTTIKGAQRPKRVGGGQYDLGYLCELLFYERENNGLHTFKDCAAIEPRKSIRGKWQNTALLSYFCLLAGSGSVPSVQNPLLYQHLLAALRELENTHLLIQLLLWFELHLLKLHGTAPQLQHCTVCHQQPMEPILVAPRVGGLICSDCNAKRGLPTFPLSFGSLRYLQILQRLKRPIPPTSKNAHQHPPEQDIAVMGHFTSLWMDIAPHARSVATQMAQLQLSNNARVVAQRT